MKTETLPDETAIDFDINNHGSVILINPLTEDGKQWLDENTDIANRQFFGSALAVEPRYLDYLIEGMIADGLSIR